MPGAARLLGHLRGAGVPLAVATSTPRRTYDRKMSGPAGAEVAQMFDACTCGDEVRPAAAPPYSRGASGRRRLRRQRRQVAILGAGMCLVCT